MYPKDVKKVLGSENAKSVERVERTSTADKKDTITKKIEPVKRDTVRQKQNVMESRLAPKVDTPTQSYSVKVPEFKSPARDVLSAIDNDLKTRGPIAPTTEEPWYKKGY